MDDTAAITQTPQRNEKGQALPGNTIGFKPGNTISIGNHGGRPTDCTPDVINKAAKYLVTCKTLKQIPLLQDLALDLNVARDTVHEWRHAKDEKGKKKYGEFSDICESIEALQESQIIKRGLSGKAPAFSMFLLKTKHGYIETEKRILAGDAENPIGISTNTNDMLSKVYGAEPDPTT